MTLDSASSDVPVLLIRSEGSDWLEVRPVASDGPAFLPVVGPVADAARAALSLGKSQKLGARMFVCHPDDLPILDRAARRFVDGQGYARAFAHNADGHFAVNARYKEVSLPPSAVFDPVSVALLASQLQTQRMLEQIQAQLRDIQDALDYLKRVDGLDLESDILGNAAMVDDVWRSLQVNGGVPETDWDEIQHLGSVLAAQHRKVLGRLGALRERLAFTTLDGARGAQSVRAQDIGNLFRLETFVYRSLCQHFDLSLAVRGQRGEDRALPLQRATRVKAEHLRASEAEREAFAAISPTAKRELQGLVKTGLISYIDQGRTIREGQDHVRRVGSAVPATVTGDAAVMRLTEADRPRPGHTAARTYSLDSGMDSVSD